MKGKICSILLALVLVLSFNLVKAVPAMAAAPEAPVNLGTAANFVILAKTLVSTTGTTSIVGNIGISPAAASFITGFGLTMDPLGSFSTSSLVSGQVFASDYGGTTPADLTTAIGDMDIAYNAAAGRTLPNATELGAGNIGGLTIFPGLYKWGTGVIIPTNVTLDASGNTSAVFIFQIAGDLDISNGKQVLLTNGAQAKNIFWQVGGPTGATLGTTAVFNGNILSDKQIIMNSGATLNGRALAKTQVTLIANTITVPPTAGVLTGVTATSSNITANATANYTIAFTTATALTVLTIPDRIVITFPSGFNASGAAVDNTTVTQSGSDPALVSATATVVTVNVTANEPAGVQSIVLSGIVNYQTVGTAYVVSVTTQNGDAAYATLDGPTTSSVFSIAAAGLNALQMVQQPATAAAGIAIAPSVTVKAVDAFNNVIASQSVVAALQVGTGTLSGNVTRTTAASGIATFNDLKINLVGTDKVLRFTAATKTVDSSTFIITAAAVATLTVQVQPTTTVAGITIAPPVTVRAADASGNIIAGLSVVAALNTGTGTLSGTTTQSTNASGIATFNDLSINLVGTDKVLRFTAAATTVTSSTFTITAAAVATLTMQVQPTAAAAGLTIAPPVQVKAVDTFGNVIASQSVAATLQVGAGALSGTTTQSTNASGIATFNDLSINLVGTDKVLRFTAAAITRDSSTFTITAVAVATLTVQVQPPTAAAGGAITPSVTVKAVDTFGNVIAGQSVAAALYAGTGTLSGTTTQVTNASGIATFNDLSVNLSGTGKVLRFTAAAITRDSSTFNIYDGILTLHTNGWTLISTDNYILSSGNTTSAFEGVTLAYKYGATGFLSATIADLAPVEAIYVKTTSAGQVGLIYSTVVPGASTKDLIAGWNLISSATSTDANTVLSPLRYVTVGQQQGVGLATLVSQGAFNLTTGDWYIDATEWGNLASNTMNPFDGYWVYMNAAKSFGVIPIGLP